jgi:hypothetical protein
MSIHLNAQNFSKIMKYMDIYLTYIHACKAVRVKIQRLRVQKLEKWIPKYIFYLLFCKNIYQIRNFAIKFLLLPCMLDILNARQLDSGSASVPSSFLIRQRGGPATFAVAAFFKVWSYASVMAGGCHSACVDGAVSDCGGQWSGVQGDLCVRVCVCNFLFSSGVFV